MNGAAETLKARLRADIKAAMQARRPGDTKLLRVILAAVDNAEAVPVKAGPQTRAARFDEGSADATRRTLSASDLDSLLDVEIASRLSAALDYERLGRADEAERLRGEAEVVGCYLSAGG